MQLRSVLKTGIPAVPTRSGATLISRLWPSVLTVALVVTGCGGTTNQGGTLDALAGTWRGPVEITAPALSATNRGAIASYNGSTTVVSYGRSAPGQPGAGAMDGGICPDGSGSALLSGENTQATYQGVGRCAPSQLGTCAVAVFTPRLVTAELIISGGTLRVLVGGTVSGCGVDPASPAAIFFAGSRQ
jgi:hypothetical protein